MTPDEYNQRELDSGNIVISDLTELTRHWQDFQGLVVDGKLGPNTLASLHAWDPCTDLPPLEGDDDGTRLMNKTMELNLIERGQGETHGNNRGPRIEFYRTTDGTGIGPGGSGPWCATLQSSSFMRSLEDLGMDKPCATSRNAKRFGDSIGRAGRYLTVPEIACMVVWNRGSNPAQGHIAQCVSYDAVTDTMMTLDGNKNERGERYAEVQVFTHANGSWRNKLYCLSTLAARPA